MNHDHSNGGMGSRPWRHMLLMLICCLVPIGLITAVSVLGLSLDPLQSFIPYVIALMCPLMMIFMMGGMMHGQGDSHAGHDHSQHHVEAPRTPVTKQLPDAAVQSTAAATQEKCH